MDIITLESVSKKFGDFTAVDNISVGLKPFTINGFLGPNGAGKTTTIKMTCGLLRPSSGKITVENTDVVKNPEEARAKIGYMSQNFSLYPDLTVRENIFFFADLYKIEKKIRDERFHLLSEELNLRDYQDNLTGELPLGIRQRVALAAATLHYPVLLFLDEPTSGVDPLSRTQFFDFIRKYVKSHGATAVISTHYLAEATFCDEIFLFKQGRIILRGNPKEIIGNFRYNVFETIRDKNEERILSLPAHLNGIAEVYIFGKYLRIIAEKHISCGRIAEAADIDSRGITQISPAFEDIYISLTND